MGSSALANFYMINPPTIIAIQFLDGVGENIVKTV